MPYVFGGSFRELPDWYQKLIRDVSEETEALRKQEYPRYGQERIAALPPYMKQSYEEAKNIGEYAPYIKQAEKLLEPERRGYGEQLSPYMNPYTKHVIEGIGREGERTFKERILPALEAKFIGLGQHGSSRHRGMSERLARDLQNEIMNKQQEALSRSFSESSQLHHQEQLRNLERSRSLANLGMTSQRGRQEDIQLLNALGAQQQAHKQRELNESQAEFWRRQMWPHQQLAQQASIIHGVPMPSMGSSTMQYEPPQPVPELSRMGQIGSMAGQMYGMSQMGRRFKRGGRVGLSKVIQRPRRMKRK